MKLQQAGANGEWTPCNEQGWYQHNSSREQVFVGRFSLQVEPAAGGFFRADHFHGQLGNFERRREDMKREALRALRSAMMESIIAIDKLLSQKE